MVLQLQLPCDVHDHLYGYLLHQLDVKLLHQNTGDLLCPPQPLCRQGRAPEQALQPAVRLVVSRVLLDLGVQRGRGGGSGLGAGLGLARFCNYSYNYSYICS